MSQKVIESNGKRQNASLHACISNRYDDGEQKNREFDAAEIVALKQKRHRSVTSVTEGISGGRATVTDVTAAACCATCARAGKRVGMAAPLYPGFIAADAHAFHRK